MEKIIMKEQLKHVVAEMGNTTILCSVLEVSKEYMVRQTKCLLKAAKWIELKINDRNCNI